jgi:hypothetical protein
VNPASYLEPRDPFQRGRANQPDPAFPQSPGIILETSGVSLLTTASDLSASPDSVGRDQNTFSGSQP